MMFKLVKQNKGFSLVETLVAISILLISISAPLTIASRSTQSNYLAREQLVATMLAQEGIEMVVNKQRYEQRRYIDNSASYEPWDWVGSLPSNCTNGNGCSVEMNSLSLNPVVFGSSNCSTGNACRIWYNSTAVRTPYNHGGTGTSTPYTRIIRITDIGGGTTQQIAVESEVSWDTPLSADTYSIILRSTLLNTATSTI